MSTAAADIALRKYLADVAMAGKADSKQPPSPEELAGFVVGVYKTVCEHTHSNQSPAGYQQSGDGFAIVAEALSKRQCRGLKCVCESVGTQQSCACFHMLTRKQSNMLENSN